MRLMGMWWAVDSAKPECKTWKGKALSFDLSTFGWYNDERQEVKVEMKSKETTEKYKSLRSSPFSLLLWANKNQVTKNMTPLKRNMSHSMHQGNQFILLKSCLTVNGQSVKSKQKCSRFLRERKGRICRNWSPRSDQTPPNSDLGTEADRCTLLGCRSAIDVRRRWRQAAFREVQSSRRQASTGTENGRRTGKKEGLKSLHCTERAAGGRN